MKLIRHKHYAQRPGLIARYEFGIVQRKLIDRIIDKLLLTYYRTGWDWSQDLPVESNEHTLHTLVVLQEVDIAVGAASIEITGRTEF